jgi:hypothetical protein
MHEFNIFTVPTNWIKMYLRLLEIVILVVIQ